MINLRYHIVSVVAVFLALGIGVLLGSSFLGEATVDQIERNISAAQDEVEATREENQRLNDRIAELEERNEAFADAAEDELFTGRLADVPVLVIVAEGVDADSRDQLERSLANSAAIPAGTITLDDTLVLEDAAEARKLGELLGLETDRPGEVTDQVISAIAEDLVAATEPGPGTDSDPGTGTGDPTSSSTTAPGISTTGPGDPSVPEIGAEDLLPEPETVQRLIDEGYLDYEPGAGFNADLLLQSPGYRFVVATGTGVGPLEQRIVRPLVATLVAEGPRPVVVAASVSVDGRPQEVAEARRELIGPYIEGSRLGSRVSTVDNLEALPGVVATVLALEDLGEGRRGHYGVDERASSMLPQAP